MNLAPVWARYNALSVTWRLIVAAVTAVAILAVGYGAYHELWWIFGGRAATKAEANNKVEQAHSNAIESVGSNVANKIVERDVYRTEVDRTVREGQDAVAKADHGQQMDPAIDAAVADSLCKLHDSLCRGPKANPVH